MLYKSVALALAALIQVPLISAGAPDRAQEVLHRALDDRFSFNASFVLRRTDRDGSSSVYAITFVKDLGYRAVVVHPSSMAGQAQADDGKTLQVYQPDTQVLVNRQSLLQFAPDTETRLAWVRENYDVKLETGLFHLGRPASRLTLTPRNAKLGTRVVTVDEEIPLVLRESTTLAGKTQTLLEVIGMNSRAPTLSSIKLDVPETATRQTVWGPQAVKDMKFAASAVGFIPRMPSRLPLGFHYFAKQIVGEERDPFLVFRITDGLTMLHVYEWDYEGGKRLERSGMKVRLVDESRGIAFAIAGDSPDEVQEEILRAFAGQK